MMQKQMLTISIINIYYFSDSLVAVLIGVSVLLAGLLLISSCQI
jgi:hypothetical protein